MIISTISELGGEEVGGGGWREEVGGRRLEGGVGGWRGRLEGEVGGRRLEGGG